MKFIGLLLAGSCSVLLISCQTSSTGDPARRPNQLAVSARINQNPKAFSRLSSSHRKAVQRGSLVRGMSKEAARLAWGKPDKIESSGGKKVLWTYFRTEEVVFDDQSASGKLSRFYRGSEKYYDGHSSNEFRSVQREDRTVHFENGRVVAWTQSRY